MSNLDKTKKEITFRLSFEDERIAKTTKVDFSVH